MAPLSPDHRTAPTELAAHSQSKKRRIAVVVLGDLGRSPRMQYHAFALARDSADVDLVGYAGSDLHHTLREHPTITCHFLRPPLLHQQQRLPRPLFLAYSLCKAISQCCQLAWTLLWRIQKPDVVLIQNPPAIPTLLIGLIAARLRSAKVVIDWHNLGYTMLALTVGQEHLAVRLARWYERVVGKRADAHLCVSRAMQEKLQTCWGMGNVTVVYDRPREIFTPTPRDLRRALFRRLQQEHQFPPAGYDPDAPDRPALIISSTSWTADEDFSLLIEAALLCDEKIEACLAASGDQRFPHLLILLTGQGPLRSHYEARIARLALRRIHMRTLWLTAEDYPLLLGTADLGLCLHRSSSGLDLPMKVADMFGAGLPVCAFDYGPCLAERVRHGENGLVFSTSEQLANQLYELFSDFPNNTSLLDHLRRHAIESGRIRWLEGWKREAHPTFARS